jgi:hypothetical protein
VYSFDIMKPSYLYTKPVISIYNFTNIKNKDNLPPIENSNKKIKIEEDSCFFQLNIKHVNKTKIETNIVDFFIHQYFIYLDVSINSSILLFLTFMKDDFSFTIKNDSLRHIDYNNNNERKCLVKCNNFFEAMKNANLLFDFFIKIDNTILPLEKRDLPNTLQKFFSLSECFFNIDELNSVKTNNINDLNKIINLWLLFKSEKSSTTVNDIFYVKKYFSENSLKIFFSIIFFQQIKE